MRKLNVRKTIIFCIYVFGNFIQKPYKNNQYKKIIHGFLHKNLHPINTSNSINITNPFNTTNSFNTNNPVNTNS